MTEPDEPNLGVRNLGEQSLSCRKVVCIHLPGTGFNVNRNELAGVAGFYPQAYVTIVDLSASSRELPFVIARLADRHFVSPQRAMLSDGIASNTTIPLTTFPIPA